MEQDFGYVKVRMGPLFPSKGNVQPYSSYQTEFERHPPHYQSSRYLKPKYVEHATSNYDNYCEQTHRGDIGVMQSSGYDNYNNMSYHFHPKDYRYPKTQNEENLIQRRKKPLIRMNQVQRSTSFHNLSHQRPFNNGEDTRPNFPQPGSGYRSRSVNPHHRVSQESQRSSSVDPQHRLSHEGKISKGLHKVHGRDYQKEINFSTKNNNDNLKKPFIPKPDYTWHRKKKQIYD